METGTTVAHAAVRARKFLKGKDVTTSRLCSMCNSLVTTEKGVEYVEVLDNARFIARTPPIKARTSYFCMASCYARYLATGYAVFLKNTNVHLLHTTL